MNPTHHALDEDGLLRSIVQGTASQTGSAFFRSLVKNLSGALGTHGAWVTEFLPSLQRLRALAFWLGDDFVEGYEYDIAGTPCEPTIRRKSHLHIPEAVVDLFPGDPDLPRVGAVSYMGFPLLDDRQRVLGNIAVLDTRPMPESFRHLALFRVFASRATAELLRLKAEAEVRAREEKLSGLFSGAFDAIVELDGDVEIQMVNPSAEALLGVGADEAVGRPFADFLTHRDRRRLAGFLSRLDGHAEDRRSLWIPGGISVSSAGGKTVAAEATLSRFDMRGTPFYVLILRDVNERVEAEKTIASLRGETRYLRGEIQAIFNHGDIVGRSEGLRRTLEMAAEVASTDATVLLCGETGTGKEMVARAVHAASRRSGRALVTVNCAAVPHTLIESEFFGHEKGAFTGATQRREGRFALADGGTLFLDEVAELGLEMQAKLLRVLQEGEFSPVGTSRTRRVDVRVIAATNRDLATEVREGRFRPDLFYRLNVFPITIPPLRERAGDIGLLARHFVEKFASRMGRAVAPPDPACIERLSAYDWPGNVRELQNVIERGVITSRSGRLNLDFALPPPRERETFRERAPQVQTGTSGVLTAAQLQALERDNLVAALEATRWQVAGRRGAARLLGIPPSTLQSRMKALGIHRPS